RRRSAMSPENWRRVDTIYEQVQEKDPQGLKQFLDATCADDPPEVRAKVDELLRPPQEPETTVFDEVRRQVTALLSTDDAIDKAHPLVAGCEILPEPVGEVWPKVGGMGVIWRARDLQFGCDLAIKVMKAKFAGTRWVRCFFAEARITAQLAHPSIVPV